MKKKFKNKKKFKDIDEIYVNPNSKILDGSEYKTDIENLKLLFPDFDEDTLYDIYNSKSRNLLLTKNAINEMLNSDLKNINEKNDNFINENSDNFINENYDNFINENNDNFINENNDKYYNKNSINHKKKNKKNKGIDITNKSNFIIIGNDEDLKEKENPKEEKKEINSIFDLIKEEQHEMNEKKKKKDEYEYESIFYDNNNNYNNYDNYNNNINEETQFDNYYFNIQNNECIDELMLNEYVNFLEEILVTKNREEITKAILDNDLDIDKTVLDYFEENFEKRENLSNFEKEQIICNFANFSEEFKELNFDPNIIFKNNIQKEIEDKIKEENLNKVKQLEYEKNFPKISKENQSTPIKNSNDEESEILNKKISEINNPQYKKDLLKLCKNFPLIDEGEIKWTYYNYLDYSLSSQHLTEKYSYQKKGLDSILNDNNVFYNQFQNNNIELIEKNPFKKQVEIFDKNISQEEKQRINDLLFIINQNPENWKFNKEDNINLKDYITIRKKLMYQAGVLFAQKKYAEGKNIMNKAKRYKQEINHLMQKKKIQKFIENNKEREIDNKYYLKNQSIDIHGLNLNESKLIISKKIEKLKDLKNKNELNNIFLEIITGKGLHSKNNERVLYPNLLEWLNNSYNFKIKKDDLNGILTIII
jgi:DNA-nicking Smr family endonuclease